MLAHDGVDFFDINMLTHRVRQQIELARFILRILEIAIQRRQPFTLAQAVNQRAGLARRRVFISSAGLLAS